MSEYSYGCIFDGTFNSRVPVGYFENEELRSVIFTEDKIKEAVKRMCVRFPGYIENYILSHLFENGTAIPITYYHGLIVYLQREDDHLYIVTDLKK